MPPSSEHGLFALPHTHTQHTNTTQGLAEYKNLEVLTLDNNPVTAVAGLPALPNLKTLWLNNNSIADVEEAVEVFASQLPNLEYLSILGNPGAKSELTGASKAQCETQRHFITYKIPSLKFLNASPITAQDKAEAAKKSKVLQSLVSGDQIDKTATVKITTHAVLDQESKKQQPSFGKQRRFYTGKFSEGNRFICDDAL